MPNFLSLSDAIKYQIDKHDSDTKIKIPAYYDSSGLFGKQNI